jgi:hypothetical protein
LTAQLVVCSALAEKGALNHENKDDHSPLDMVVLKDLDRFGLVAM